jgi:predicted RecA/RadA family phage recombinase
MAGTTFFHTGDRIDYTPTNAVSAGTVVAQGDLLGVVANDIPANRLGALCVEGAHLFPKTNGVTFSAGQKVYWDPTNVVASPDSRVGPVIGRVAVAAASGDATVRVLLDMTVTPDLLFAAIVSATVVTNTVTETTFDQNVPIAANRLQVGDVIRVRGMGVCPSTNSTDTLTVKLKLGATVIVATAAVDVANNDIWLIEADIVVRALVPAVRSWPPGIRGWAHPAQ